MTGGPFLLLPAAQGGSSAEGDRSVQFAKGEGALRKRAGMPEEDLTHGAGHLGGIEHYLVDVVFRLATPRRPNRRSFSRWLSILPAQPATE